MTLEIGDKMVIPELLLPTYVMQFVFITLFLPTGFKSEGSHTVSFCKADLF